MPFQLKLQLNIILPVTHVWDSQAFLVSFSSPYGEASGSVAPRPAQQYARNRNRIYSIIFLSDLNIRYNRKWGVNRIWFAVLRTPASFKTHYIIPLQNWPVRLQHTKMELRFWRKLWQSGKISRQLPVDSILFLYLTGWLSSYCKLTQEKSWLNVSHPDVFSNSYKVEISVKHKNYFIFKNIFKATHFSSTEPSSGLLENRSNITLYSAFWGPKFTIYCKHLGLQNAL
jgi:hypothetical protein